MSAIETKTPEQLARAAGVSPDALVPIQEPGGPVTSVSVRTLFRNLTASDAVHGTEAQLAANLAHGANALGLVYADPDPAKNGWYRKVGASGSGNWAQFDILVTRAGTLLDAALATANERLALAQAAVVEAQGFAALAASWGLGVGRASLLLRQYVSIQAGLAAVADGQSFVVVPASPSNFGRVYTRVGDRARFVTFAPVTADGEQRIVLRDAMRARASRPKYEWAFGQVRHGRAIVNTGTRAAAVPEPDTQMIGGMRLVWDADGGSANTRAVWPAGVLNSNGQAECVNLTFSSAADRLSIFYRPDYTGSGMVAQDVTVTASLRVADGSTGQPMVLGSSSDASGVRTAFTPGAGFVEQVVTIDGVDAVQLLNVELRPAGAGVTYPFTVTIERISAQLKGEATRTLADLRSSALAGHLKPSWSSQDGIRVQDGAFVPTQRAPSLIAELSGEVITEMRMSCYLDAQAQAYPSSTVYAMAFPREQNTSGNAVPENRYNFGALAVKTGAGDVEYVGRMQALAGADLNQTLGLISDTVVTGGGTRRFDVMIAGSAFNARINNNFAQAGGKQYCVFMDGVPQMDHPCDPMPAGFAPRELFIAGIRPATTRPNALLVDGNVNSPMPGVARFDTNMGLTPAAAILQELLDDIAAGRVTLPTPVVHVMTEGDSTSRFSGGMPHWFARQLAGPGRLFTNMSAGGSYYATINPPPDTHAFNHPLRAEFRKDVLRANKGRAFPLGLYIYHGGENAPTHYAVPATGYAQLVNMMVAEANEIGTAPGCKLLPVICTVRPSGLEGAAGAAQKVPFNAYLRGRFATATACPFLFAPTAGDTTTGFRYMIDLDAWVPRFGATNYASWIDCLRQTETVTLVDAAAAQAAGPGRPAPLLGSYKLTLGADPDKFYRHAGAANPGGDSFAVTFGNGQTRYYLYDTDIRGGTPVISGDLQHWQGTNGGEYAALDVFTPAIREITLREIGVVL